MNTLTNNHNSTSLWTEQIATGITHLDSNTLLSLAGMLCTTTLLCVSLTLLLGGQITVTKDGISIIRPKPHVNS